ncbi:MAG: hypothetical protein E6J79_03625 [Deltaproteobacteria bacterium]|nr:MAG: hypothetical protein E6J79_03625 [Deltaproteobacteria bacterium]
MTRVAGILGVLILAWAAVAGVPPVPIPEGPDANSVPAFLGSPAVPQRIPAPRIPQHPFMAPNGRSNVHDDAYMTDTYVGSGPLGRTPEARSTFQAAECGSVTFDSAGRIVTICVGVEGPELVLIDAQTLETEAVMPLPPRSPSGTSVFSDFSGGGYFYLDQLDRAVIPTNNRQIWVVGESASLAGPGFTLVRTYDLSSGVALGDGIVSVLPDWHGLLWFVTVHGVVGTVEPASGALAVLALDGEAIGNSFAVDETGGVFIVSDHALYRFDAGASGVPLVTWRETYDRGTRLKPGQVNFGSGTTPTLMGCRWVAITDNADPRMHVLVYRRAAAVSGSRLVCTEPVFADGMGATENSLIGVGTRSLVVENNYGYSGPTVTENGGTTEPGITRIDLGAGGCRTVWTSGERVPSTVSKVSLGAGLVYTYTKDPEPNNTDAWYFTAVDFRTGQTVYKRRAGTGLGFNNNFAPVTLGPDGTAYVGALGGLVQIRDEQP